MIKYMGIKKVGRPAKIDKKILIETIIKYKKDIIRKDYRIISKNNPIWNAIAEELDNNTTLTALYWVCA